MSIYQGQRSIHRSTPLLLGVLLVGVLVIAGCQSTAGKAPAASAAKPAATVAKPAAAAVKAAPAATGGEVTETVTTSGTGSAAAAPAAGATTMPMVMLHDDAKLGKILVDAAGMTLYVFDKDTADKSACAGDCASKWPPLTVADASAKPMAGEGVTGALGVITRDDGKMQVTINEMPLYTYASDMKAGETTGEAVGDVWWVANAAGAKVAAQ